MADDGVSTLQLSAVPQAGFKKRKEKKKRLDVSGSTNALSYRGTSEAYRQFARLCFVSLMFKPV